MPGLPDERQTLGHCGIDVAIAAHAPCNAHLTVHPACWFKDAAQPPLPMVRRHFEGAGHVGGLRSVGPATLQGGRIGGNESMGLDVESWHPGLPGRDDGRRKRIGDRQPRRSGAVGSREVGLRKG